MANETILVNPDPDTSVSGVPTVILDPSPKCADDVILEDRVKLLEEELVTWHQLETRMNDARMAMERQRTVMGEMHRRMMAMESIMEDMRQLDIFHQNNPSTRDAFGEYQCVAALEAGENPQDLAIRWDTFNRESHLASSVDYELRNSAAYF